MTCYLGDCRDVMRDMDADSVDAIVTDPPYGLEFMGKDWDRLWDRRPQGGFKNAGRPGPSYRAGIEAEDWHRAWAIEALRVAKPGTHLLAFGGTRTFHRLACAIEDAGWEIRDTVMWIYGSGFPKSLDVSKAIDKAAGAEREKVCGGVGPAYQRSIGNTRPWMSEVDHKIDGPDPITAAARQWDGWGTALKPAYEPIILARKPLIGTVAQNVLAHGTGALNIDGGRIEGAPWTPRNTTGLGSVKFFSGDDTPVIDKAPHGLGRWPANLIHDGSEEVLAAFPQAPGQSGAITGDEPSSKTRTVFGLYNERPTSIPRGDTGSAARFFYTAKASQDDRNFGLGSASRSSHPTVKPTDLMRYLCRLVTPPGGLVLDPFMGSGSTGKAAKLEGFRFIGIEQDETYLEIARNRIHYTQAQEAMFA